MSHSELAGRNRSVSGQDPLPEPIRLQDLENSARSQAKKKINEFMVDHRSYTRNLSSCEQL